MADNNEIISTAVQFRQRMRQEDYVKLKFIKKNLEERIMKATLNFERIPRQFRPKNVDLPRILTQLDKHKQLRVFDLEKQGWRTVPFESVEWVEDRLGARFRLGRDFLKK